MIIYLSSFRTQNVLFLNTSLMCVMLKSHSVLLCNVCTYLTLTTELLR